MPTRYGTLRTRLRCIYLTRLVLSKGESLVRRDGDDTALTAYITYMLYTAVSAKQNIQVEVGIILILLRLMTSLSEREMRFRDMSEKFCWWDDVCIISGILNLSTACPSVIDKLKKSTNCPFVIERRRR